ncbi:MAG TPA: M28 family peptidase [Anaerolineales bacterium]|nr:M28 family peptidase [Anaerolineales bacterium]
MFNKVLRLFAVVAVLALTLAYAPNVSADLADCENRVNDTHEKLLECVTLESVREHQAALQAIADANEGTRASGTAGYDASVRYVVEKMTAAGYNVAVQHFPFIFFPVGLQQTAPIVATYNSLPATETGFGTVSAAVVAVDINLVPPRANTSGCEAADFNGFSPGSIALVQRGTCPLATQVLNAEAAGASAVIIFNQGDAPTPERTDVFLATLGVTHVINIPVLTTSYRDGEALAQVGSEATVSVGEPQILTSYNVIAESRDGDPNNVVIAGAHLDSVSTGPGINDNGSGSAALLEVAEQMAKVTPRNRVRFAWWGGEEAGLFGSFSYVISLFPFELAKVALYLNFDMVGSPNHVFFIYDGDDSDAEGAGPGPAGSAEIEKTFEQYFTSVGVPFKGTDFTGRSDYGPFILAGIPSGGLFTGAERVKTAEEAAIWGGTAGVAYDPCYHQACDNFANNSDFALDVNSNAMAYAVLQYAMNTSDVSGIEGASDFKLAVP